jgi:DNA-binding FadR family transcriptional regulator
MSATRHEAIADVLIDEILRGQYRTGERLPSERDLATRFDANRAAVRVAIQKLEQLGLADVQPGGVRVRPIEEANLDVIGELLALEDVPDPELMEQVLEVMGTLMRLAAKRAVQRASDDQIEYARELLRRTRRDGLSSEQVAQARMELGQLFMTLSGNLVLRLIGNSLRVQVMGRTDARSPLLTLDPQEDDTLHRKLDEALASRRAGEAVTVLERLMAMNTEHVVNTLRSAREAGVGPAVTGP